MYILFWIIRTRRFLSWKFIWYDLILPERLSKHLELAIEKEMSYYGCQSKRIFLSIYYTRDFDRYRITFVPMLSLSESSSNAFPNKNKYVLMPSVDPYPILLEGKINSSLKFFFEWFFERSVPVSYNLKSKFYCFSDKISKRVFNPYF